MMAPIIDKKLCVRSSVFCLIILLAWEAQSKIINEEPQS